MFIGREVKSSIQKKEYREKESVIESKKKIPKKRWNTNYTILPCGYILWPALRGEEKLEKQMHPMPRKTSGRDSIS